MTPLILQAGWRQLTRYRGQWLLSVLAITLGVAVVVAVDLANQSALGAFRAAHDLLAGRASHQLVAGPAGLDQALYRRLRIEHGLRRSAPVVEGRAVLPALDETLTLLGLDPFAEAPFRGYAAVGGSANVAGLIARPRTALLSAGRARALGLSTGEDFEVRLGGRRVRLTLAGTLAAGPAADELVVVDIATAQELLGRLGRLSRIDLILEDGAAETLTAALPPGVRLLSAAGQAESLGELSRAFRLNLTALSLLALLVGLFLIYNTLSFAVVRRRPIIGTLRALGATRGEVLRGLLLEAALLGAVGTLLGLALGVPLAQGLVQLVGRTVQSLYYEQAVVALEVAPLSLLKAVALGLLGAVLAAAVPAREAASLPPRSAMSRATLERGSRRWLLRAVLLGLLLAALGGLVLAASSGVSAGFVALFALVLGAALGVPAVTVLLLHPAAALLGRLAGLPGRLAARGAAASLSRTGVAVTALAVAVAAVVGVGVMIHSFRVGVIGWLEHTLQADYYLSADTAGGRSALGPARLQRLRGLPGVGSVQVNRWLELPTADGPVQLWAMELDRRAWRAYQFLAGEPQAAWEAFQAGAVVLSEPYAHRRGLSVGDSLVLPTREGPRRFPIAGVYRDYGSDRGTVRLSADTLQRWFGVSPATGAAIYAAAGADPAVLEQGLRELAAAPGLRLRSQRALKARSLEVFDQTFAITEVLRLLAGVVAFAGVLAALAALQLERARETAVLRALGFTPGQLVGLGLTQSGLLGLAAGLCALPLGVLLSGLLVHVILLRAFGWSMALAVAPGSLIAGVALAVVAALLAGLYPAWRDYRSLPAQALREEA